MNGILGFWLLLSTFLGSQGQDWTVATARLKVNVSGVAADGGNIHVAIHKEATFLQDESALSSIVLSPRGEADVSGQLEALPHDTYAVAVFQDMNGNNQLDKNALGIPTEPYAFSNNPVVKWRAPTFNDAAVPLTQAEQAISITLKYWKDY
jgi:uncharacterized protein (DUF2141 family)